MLADLGTIASRVNLSDVFYYGIGIAFIACLFAMAHLAFNEDGL